MFHAIWFTLELKITLPCHQWNNLRGQELQQRHKGSSPDVDPVRKVQRRMSTSLSHHPMSSKHYKVTSSEGTCVCMVHVWARVCTAGKRGNRAGPSSFSTRATFFSIFAVATRHPVMILRLLLSPSCLPAPHKAGQRTLGPKSRDCYCKPAFHSLSSSLILGFFHFRKEYRADGGDGCTTVRMYLMPLNCTHKNG